MLDFIRLQQQLRGFAAYQQQQRDLLQENCRRRWIPGGRSAT